MDPGGWSKLGGVARDAAETSTSSRRPQTFPLGLSKAQTSPSRVYQGAVHSAMSDGRDILNHAWGRLSSALTCASCPC